jgi:DNA-binding NarL/FixJ family response regulator
VIRVLVASPKGDVRNAVSRLLRADPGLVLVGTTHNPESLEVAIAESGADVIVLDPGAPQALSPRIPQLIPTVLLSDDPREALRNGARAVVPRDASAAELHAAVHAAAAGLIAYPAELANGGPIAANRRDGHAPLTARERAILALLGEGLVNKEIAARLGISEHTVKSHLAAIYEKLGAANRAEAVATGLRRGLIML